MSVVYLNGAYLDRDQARVSVLDRGFLFGDGVYEVIPAYAGRAFLLDRHLERLARSLAAVGIEPPLQRGQWRAIVDTVLTRNGGGDQSVYLQVTRGVAEREHVLSAPVPPTVLVMSRALPGGPPAPVRAVTRADLRWDRCDIKAIALLANVMLRQDAAAAGAYEAIMVRDGHLTEGAASNVFVVSAGRVCTPAHASELLAGITRDVLVELLRGAGVPVHEGVVSETQLHAADEIWLTSSTREVVPVIELDGRAIGGGHPGPRWRQAWQLYQACKAAAGAGASHEAHG